MDVRRRITGPLLVVGGVAVPVAAGAAVASAHLAKSAPWLVASATFYVAALVVHRRAPHHPITFWFVLTTATFPVLQVLESVLLRADEVGGLALAAAAFLHQTLVVVGAVAAGHLLGTFTDGVPRDAVERRTLRSLWWFLAFPPVVALVRPTVLLPSYLPVTDTLVNPFAVAPVDWLAAVAAFGATAAQSAFGVGAVLLVRRYRGSDGGERRRIRWLLVPGVLATFVVVIDVLAWALSPEGAVRAPAQMSFGILWVAVLVTLPVVIAIALLRPGLLDVDLVIRRSLVYGVLWGLIALAYLAAAAGSGLLAGQRFPVEAAIVLTVVATVAFQPARRWLERLADRWVFGERLGAYDALRHLGRVLEEGFALPDLAPRLADTVRGALGLSWVRVVVGEGDGEGDEAASPATGHDALAGDAPAAGTAPSAVVPVVADGETVGRIELGVAPGRRLDDDDRDLLREVARQAGVAMRTVRLTAALEATVTALGRRTAELEDSRSRLFRVQAAERRRLERDLHDGVQQDVVALIGRVGIARRQAERDPVAAAEVLAGIQEELGRILNMVRELAHGIHPTLLTDRGLVEALEAQAARSPLPISVSADEAARRERYPEEVEGAAYFTVSEALANVLKHAEATQAWVHVARWNGSLRVEVRDDGRGFDAGAVRGEGLVNLAERLEAVGGRLDLLTRPGAGTTVAAEIGIALVDHGERRRGGDDRHADV